ncbi:MAG: hypothetical protein JXA78_14475 [Anaerolineales bacterium]|nr:hypothetical protein [Anaerolineales bacterium]
MNLRFALLIVLCLSLASLTGCMGAMEQQIEQVDEIVERAEQGRRAAAEANFESLSQIAMVENDGLCNLDFHNSSPSPMAVKIVHADYPHAWKLLELPVKGKQSLEIGPGRYLLKVQVGAPGEAAFYKTEGFDLEINKKYKFTMKLSDGLLDLGSLGVSVIDIAEYAR